MNFHCSEITDKYKALVYKLSFFITKNDFRHITPYSKTWMTCFYNIKALSDIVQRPSLNRTNNQIALFILVRRRGVDFKIFTGLEIKKIKTTTNGEVKFVGGDTIRLNFKDEPYSIFNLAYKVSCEFEGVESYDDLIKSIKRYQ